MLFIKKSDNSFKIIKLKISKIGLCKHLFKKQKIRYLGGILKNGAADKNVYSHWLSQRAPFAS